MEVGFDSIAQASGASRTTLYRWWSSPQELLLDALLETVRPSIDVDEHAPVLPQLRSHLMLAARALVDPPTAAPLRVLASGALASETAHEAFVEHWLTPRRAAARALIERGIREGALIDEDPDAMADMLFGPIYHRVFFTGDAVSDAFIDSLIRRVETSIGCAAPTLSCPSGTARR